MSKAEKREQKIRQNTKNVSLDDFEWLICKYGSIKMGGNHAVAVINGRLYPYPRKNPVQQPYVIGLLKIIDRQ